MACRGGCRLGRTWGWGVVAASRLIPVRVGDIEIEVEAVPVAGTEATSGRAEKAAGNVLEAFGRAQACRATLAGSGQGGGWGVVAAGRLIAVGSGISRSRWRRSR